MCSTWLASFGSSRIGVNERQQYLVHDTLLILLIVTFPDLSSVNHLSNDMEIRYSINN